MTVKLKVKVAVTLLSVSLFNVGGHFIMILYVCF